MPFKLLFVTNIPTPYRQAFFNEISRFFRDKSEKVAVCYMANSEANREWKVDFQKSDFEQFFMDSRSRSFFGIETYISITPFFLWLRTSPENTILAGAWHYPANFLIVIAARILKRKVWFWCESNKYTDKSKSYFLVILRSIFYKINKNYLAPGHMSYNYIKNLNSNATILFLPNAVESIFFNKQITSFIPNFTYNKFNFVTISELVDRKGVLELIEDFDYLINTKKIPYCSVLHICGSGILEYQVRKVSAKRPWIKFHGFKSGIDLIKIMQNCCGFILNTKLDPNPLVVNEACCLGLIPLISRRAGNAYDVTKISNSFDFTYEFGELKKSLEKYSITSSYALEEYSKEIKGYAGKFKSDEVARNLIESLRSGV